MKEKSQDAKPMDLDANDAILRETTFPKEISFFQKAAIGANDKDIPVFHASAKEELIN